MCKNTFFINISVVSILALTSCSKSGITPEKKNTLENPTDTSKTSKTNSPNLPTGVITTFGNSSNAWITAMQGTSQSLQLENLDNNKIATDSQGNVYVLFNFNGVIDIDPSATILLAGGLSELATLAKYNAAGKLLWSKQFTTSGNSYVIALTTDAFDNVYCCLRCYNTSTLQFGGNSYSPHNGTNNEIIKFSNSGNMLWLREIGGGQLFDIKTDPAGNIYADGALFGGVTFYNSPTDNQLSYTGPGSPDVYYWVKFDGNGQYVAASTVIWATMTLNNDVIAPVFTVDPDQNVYMAGIGNTLSYTSNFPVILGDLTLSSTFLAKYNKIGAPLWLKGYDNYHSIAIMDKFLSLSADFQDNLYLLGRNTPASSDLIWKMDGQGNDLWNKVVTKSLSDGHRSLRIDSKNNVFVAGDYLVDPASSIVQGNRAIFFYQFNASGATIYTKNLLGYSINSYISFFDATVDNNSNINVIGYFIGSIDLLGNGGDPNNPWSDYNNSFFIAHFSESQ